MIALNEYDIGAAFRVVEDELIKSMIRNMDRHRAEETEEGIEWSMWQTEQMKALEKYKKDNQKRYGKQFQDLNRRWVSLSDRPDRKHAAGNQDTQCHQKRISCQENQPGSHGRVLPAE